MGVPISWKSKTQQGVVLSSAEGEYVASSELVKEVMFVKQLLEEIGIVVQIPIKIKVDNMGAIFMARNNVGNSGTRHVNIRTHYQRELVKQGIIEFQYIRTDLNTADIMTKNPTKAEHIRHTKGMIDVVPSELWPKQIDDKG